ncbi:MAG: YrhK family protein [Myxococcales bacterium]
MNEVERDEHAGSPDTLLRVRGPGPFVTEWLVEEPSGEHRVRESRRNRKGLDAEPEQEATRAAPQRALPMEPRSFSWWIAVLFMVGSALFALASAVDLSRPHAGAYCAATYFVGSLFFSSAAYLQLGEVINERDPVTKRYPAFAWWRFQPRKLAWWACLIQFCGTLLFNRNTFEGMRTLNPVEEDVLVWAPDAVGSLCFLVASYMAFAEVCHRWFRLLPGNISWWVVFINLLGSVAFGLSAVGSYVAAGGHMLSPFESSLWTLVGAVCFLVGAYLMLSEMAARYASPTSPTAQRKR